MSRERARKAAPTPTAAPAWWAPVALLAAGLITYANSFGGLFLFDDLGTIVRNPQIRALWRLSQVLVPPADTAVAGRPLVNLSFALNYALGGTNVWGYHAVNLALHLTCALLIYALIRRLAGTSLAFAVALLWTVHPLNTEVVNYLTQRTESMMAVCVLLTLYAARREWRIVAIIACALGMLCKETMVMAPVAVVLIDWAFGEEVSFGATWRRRWPLYAALVATWLIPAAMLATRGQTTDAGFATAQVSTWTYLLNQPAMILRYLRLALWPSDLVLYYGWPRPLSFADVWLPFVIVSALLVGSVAALVKWRRVGAMAVWVFLWLGPTSSLIPIATEVGAERRMYLPLIGVLVLAVAALAWAAKRMGREMRPLPAVVVAVATVALGATTYARSADYTSSLRIANTVLARWPTANAHQLVGTELLAAGRYDEALPHLRIAAERYPPARYFLGQALFSARQYDEAIGVFEQFTREEPSLAPVATQLLIAKAYGASGRMPQAAEHLSRVLAAEPNNIEAHGFMAEALAAQKRFAEAVPHYQAFLETNSRNAAVWTGLGMAFVALGKPAEAVPAFQTAAEAEPGNSRFRQNLARLLLDQGDVAGAIREAEQAVTINAQDAVAFDALGRALARAGRLQGARAAFTRAVAIDPSFAPAIEALKQLAIPRFPD